MLKHPLTLVAVSAAITTAAITAYGAEGISLKDTVWKPVCKIATELGTIANQAYKTLDHELEMSNTHTIQSLRARIYSQIKSGTKDGDAAEITAAYYASLVAIGTQAMQTQGLSKILTATRDSTYLQGRIHESLEIMAAISDSTNNGCLLPGNTPAQGATYSLGNIADEACKLETTPLTKGDKTTEEITATGYANIATDTPGAGNFQPATSGSLGQCLLKANHATDGYGHTTVSGVQLKFLGHYLTAGTSGNEATFVTSDKLKTTGQTAAKPWADAFAAINNMPTAGQLTPTNETADLETRTALAAITQKLLMPKDDSDSQRTKTQISNLLGGNTETRLDELRKKIDSEQIPAGVRWESTKKRLGDINDVSELQELLSHYILVTARRVKQLTEQVTHLQSQVGETKVKAKESECNQHKEPQKCTEPCKWDTAEKNESEKCKLSEEGKKVSKRSRTRKWRKLWKN
uniref:Variant surface glycoprotein 1185 n=1 Tax=Trypanosoma brucei TaxID=5691 RepID=M4SUS5_9TRYP|nr:variant surface glycoprotein 1185 [Trypanosoma brucei]